MIDHRLTTYTMGHSKHLTLRSLAATFLFISLPQTVDATPFRVPFATDKTFGHDGPWNAVEIGIGEPPQYMHFIPGGRDATEVLGPKVCDQVEGSRNIPFASCPAKDGGNIYDETKDSSLIKASKEDGSKVGRYSFHYIDVVHENVCFSKMTIGKGRSRVELENANISIRETSIDNLDGKIPSALGKFSLGANPKYQAGYEVEGSKKSVIAQGKSMINQLAEDGKMATRMVNLHIGAAGHKQQGSMIFGGYEKGRMMRPPGRIKDQADVGYFNAIIEKIALKRMDAVESNNDRSKDATLVDVPNLQIEDGNNVDLEFQWPYMYLQPHICDALAERLPITYQRAYKLYLWDEIPKEALYLEFTFDSLPKKVVIRVPMPLLQLDLTDLVMGEGKGAKYFPCRHKDKGFKRGTLGRAFFQAVNFVYDWDTGNFWLGQAPGPNGKNGIKDQSGEITELKVNQKELDAAGEEGDGKWEESWAGIWDPILEEKNKTGGLIEKGGDNLKDEKSKSELGANKDGDKKSNDDGGLSTGAVAGIAVGVAFGVTLTLIAAFILFCRRQKRNNHHMLPQSDSSQELPDSHISKAHFNYYGQGSPGMDTPLAQLSGQPVSEMGTPAVVPQLEGSTPYFIPTVAAELADTAYHEHWKKFNYTVPPPEPAVGVVADGMQRNNAVEGGMLSRTNTLNSSQQGFSTYSSTGTQQGYDSYSSPGFQSYSSVQSQSIRDPSSIYSYEQGTTAASGGMHLRGGAASENLSRSNTNTSGSQPSSNYSQSSPPSAPSRQFSRSDLQKPLPSVGSGMVADGFRPGQSDRNPGLRDTINATSPTAGEATLVTSQGTYSRNGPIFTIPPKLADLVSNTPIEHEGFNFRRASNGEPLSPAPGEATIVGTESNATWAAGGSNVFSKPPKAGDKPTGTMGSDTGVADGFQHRRSRTSGVVARKPVLSSVAGSSRTGSSINSTQPPPSVQSTSAGSGGFVADGYHGGGMGAQGSPPSVAGGYVADGYYGGGSGAQGSAPRTDSEYGSLSEWSEYPPSNNTGSYRHGGSEYSQGGSAMMSGSGRGGSSTHGGSAYASHSAYGNRLEEVDEATEEKAEGTNASWKSQARRN